MTNKLKKHEQEYIHISKNSFKNFFTGLFFSVLTFFSFKLLYYKWKDLGLDILFNCEENCSQFSNIYQVDIIPILFITAGLIFLSISYLFSIPRKTSHNSLIYGLGGGLIFGTLAGLFCGVTNGAVAVIVCGLISGTLIGLFGALLIGLVEGVEAKADNQLKDRKI